MARDLHHATRLFDGHLRLDGDLFDGRLATQLLQQRLLDIAQFGHRLDHVHGHANRACVIRDGTGDRLTNPPSGVGREFVAALVFVLVDRAHQTSVAFLDDVEEGKSAIAILLGNRNHQTQVAAGKIALGLFVLAEDAHDVAHATLKLVHWFKH